MDNQYGKKSILKMTINADGYKTYLENIYFTAPFKVMQPFYSEDGKMEVMILLASAGMMEGDFQEISIHVKKDSQTLISSQSFEKIHRMKNGYAKREAFIHVERNAVVEYSPLPIIPFNDSAFKNTLRVELEDASSGFIYSEIISGGRKAYGEMYGYKYFYSLIEVFLAGKIVYRENAMYNPSLFEMGGMGMMEGFSHLANILAFNMTQDQKRLEWIREDLENRENIEGAVTELECHGICIKIWGNTAQELLEACRKYVKELVNV